MTTPDLAESVHSAGVYSVFAGSIAEREHRPVATRGLQRLWNLIVGLRGSRLALMTRILLSPLVIAGYVGLVALLFLPLLGLRSIFPRDDAWHGERRG